MEKCPKCGEKFSRKPLFEFVDGKKKPIWKNWFYIDWVSVLIIISMILTIIGYRDINNGANQCISKPIEFCESNGYCDYIQTRNEIIIDNKMTFNLSELPDNLK